MPQDSSLHKACYEGNINVVLAILSECQDDVNSKGAQDRTPLHRAAGAGHLEVVDTLISFNADINASDKFCRTPLHWACLGGHSAVVKKLLQSQAINVNCKASNGWTALHAAASINDTESIIALLEADVDACAIDEHGHNAYQVAVENNHKPFSKLKEACKGALDKKKKGWLSGVFSNMKVTPRESCMDFEDLNSQLKLQFIDKFNEYQSETRKPSQLQFDRIVEIAVQEAKDFEGFLFLISDAPDVFCIVDCDGQKKRTPIVTKSQNPFFGENFEL